MDRVRAREAQPAARHAEAPRCAARPLHDPLGRDRDEAPGGSDVAARPRVRLESLRPRAARDPPPRADARRDAARDAGVGEQRQGTELRAGAAARLPRVRARGRGALPVGSLLADLERAEPSALAEADEGVDLRRSMCSTPATRGSTRCCAHALVGGGVTAPRGGLGGVAPVTWLRGMARAHAQARRVRPQPVPAAAGRDAVGARLPLLPEHHDGDAAEALDPRPALLGAEAGLADGVRLPDEPARPVPRRVAAAAGDAAQPRRDARVAARARDDADPVPLRRRAAAQPFPDRARRTSTAGRSRR